MRTFPFRSGNISLKVLRTPAHTPGSLCFLKGKHLISGDTIFHGGPGKTKSTADLEQIIESITLIPIPVIPVEAGLSIKAKKFNSSIMRIWYNVVDNNIFLK
jgi:hypothetical protein